MQAERKLVAKFDADKNGWLNVEERSAARKELAAEPQRGGPDGPGFRGRGGRGGGPGFRLFPFPGGEEREPAKPGQHLAPADVRHYPDAALYDPSVLRTLFLEFDTSDWEKELSDFHNTDVEVPAKLIVDGREYPHVGVHFRGMSSYMGVPAGYKRSLNVSLDFLNKDQRLYGYRTLNLLNGHEDDSLMSSVLYSHIARQHIPAPKANFVRLVINGEDWGVYANVEQFNKDLVQENFGTSEGARWKVRGNPGADGGLRYLGEDIEPYRERFTIKSKDEERAWRDLIKLCRTLNETPAEELEAALEPLLDIEGTLWFLALDVALVNNDGYWVRASDYSLYQDPKGRFHLIPSDMNESFHSGGGPRRGLGPGGRRGRGPRGEAGPGGFDRRPSAPENSNEDPPEQPAERLADSRSADRNTDISNAAENGRRLPGEPQEDGEFGLPPGEDRPVPPDFGPPEFGPPGIGPPDGGGPLFGPPDGGPGFGRPRFGGPFGGGRGGGGVKLDPLVGLENERTPLRRKLLGVPSLRTRYLAHVREIAEHSLDWDHLGAVVTNYRTLIREAVEHDTRKLSSFEAFLRATSDEAPSTESNEREASIRTFAEKRREFLLDQTTEGKDETSPVKEH
jgi:hypothetical protein